MKILANATVTKRVEYSQSYGGAETISVAFIKDLGKEIVLLNECGEGIRLMRKGTKLLISFSGKEITERTLNLRTKKSKQEREAKRLETVKAQQEVIAKRQAAANEQLSKWSAFLSQNPQKVEKYKEMVNTMPSSKWRNTLRMKAVKHVAGGKFENLEASAPELKQILFTI